MNPVTRRSLFAAVGVTIAAGSSSCSKTPMNFLNKEFLVKIASTIGVEVELEVTFGELKDLFSDLANGISSKWDEWRSGGEIGACRAHKVMVDNAGRPTIVVMDIDPVYITDEICKAAEDPTYPLNQSCAVFFDTANDAILLPGWAWQTLLMFVEQQKIDKEGAILKQTEQLLRLSLCPTSSHTEEYETWANAVSTVSWQTGLGPVDIGRIEKDDHTYKGVIKVSGFPDEEGSPIVFEEDIPTSLPTKSDGWWS